nr:trypco2 family protein [Streptomyces albus]
MADAVKGVRSELNAALADGQDDPIRFELGPVELEFSVDVRKDDKAAGGVKVWVLRADGEKSSGHTTAGRLHVTLNPVDEHGAAARISSRRDPAPPPPPPPAVPGPRP